MSYLLQNVQPGDPITVIRSFYTGGEGFRVGQTVTYLRHKRSVHNGEVLFADWLVEFEFNGAVFKAADDLFTTEMNLGELKDVLLQVYIEEEAKKLMLKEPPADYKWWMDWAKLMWYFCMIFLFFWMLAALFAK